jgi:hypothetical protein
LVENIPHVDAWIPSDFDPTNAWQDTSFTSSQKIYVTFRNKLNQPAMLYWVGFDGSAREITEIPSSGGSAQVLTIAGHLWQAKTQDGHSLGSYVATAN